MMKNLKQIINKGLINSLIIDDEVSGINYKHSEINSHYDTFDLLVHNFIEKQSKEDFDAIIEIYEKTGKQYKVKSLDEFQELAKIIYNIVNKENLAWIDTSNVLTIVMNNEMEITWSEFLTNEKYKNITELINIQFIKIADSVLNEPIYIHKKLLTNKLIKWRNQYMDKKDRPRFSKSVNKDKNNALTDYNGYKNTYNNINIYQGNINIFPAMEYCWKLHIDDYQAYMPALGQLMLIYENRLVIDYILRKIGGNTIKEICYGIGNTECIWSSTEKDENNAYVMQKSVYGGAYVYNEVFKELRKSRSMICIIFPFFKKI